MVRTCDLVAWHTRLFCESPHASSGSMLCLVARLGLAGFGDSEHSEHGDILGSGGNVINDTSQSRTLSYDSQRLSRLCFEPMPRSATVDVASSQRGHLFDRRGT